MQKKFKGLPFGGPAEFRRNELCFLQIWVSPLKKAAEKKPVKLFFNMKQRITVRMMNLILLHMFQNLLIQAGYFHTQMSIPQHFMTLGNTLGLPGLPFH